MTRSEALKIAAFIRDYLRIDPGARVIVRRKRIAGCIPSWFVVVDGKRELHSGYAMERFLDESR